MMVHSSHTHPSMMLRTSSHWDKFLVMAYSTGRCNGAEMLVVITVAFQEKYQVINKQAT